MLILPRRLRKKLKEPLGRLYASIREAPITEGAFIISVGDVTTYKLLRTGLKPQIAIIDNRIQRKKSSYKIKYDAKILTCKNPPGTITEELWTSINKALKSGGDNFLIIVDGEEDLAVLPSIILAPPDALIFYGQPNEGVVLIKAEKMKQKAENLIKQFREVKINGDQNNR